MKRDQSRHKNLDFPVIMRKLVGAGIAHSPQPNRTADTDGLMPIEERVRKVLGVVNADGRKAGNMLFKNTLFF